MLQVRDDYANLRLEEYANNKSFAEDLTEGKFNFPIIHAIRYTQKFELLQSNVLNLCIYHLQELPK